MEELLSALKDDSQEFECPACHEVSIMRDFGFFKCPICNTVLCHCNYCGEVMKLEKEVKRKVLA